jgi:hypothetical protein
MLVSDLPQLRAISLAASTASNRIRADGQLSVFAAPGARSQARKVSHCASPSLSTPQVDVVESDEPAQVPDTVVRASRNRIRRWRSSSKAERSWRLVRIKLSALKARRPRSGCRRLGDLPGNSLVGHTASCRASRVRARVRSYSNTPPSTDGECPGSCRLPKCAWSTVRGTRAGRGAQEVRRAQRGI